MADDEDAARLSVVFNVLVVDDDEASLRDAVHAINSSPYFRVIGTAAEPRVAFPMAMSVPVDVIVLDDVFPDQPPGTRSIAFFRRLAPYARIVMYSSVLTAAMREADGMVRKPDATELLAVMTGMVAAPIDIRDVPAETKLDGTERG